MKIPYKTKDATKQKYRTDFMNSFWVKLQKA